MVYKAIKMALEAHEGQKRKVDGDPYVTHPLEVGILLSQAGQDEDVVIAGILHDTIEDTHLNYDTIQTNFGKHIADLIAACSESDKSLSWLKRKTQYINGLEKASEDVLIIVCADKVSNLSSIRKDLAQHGQDLWQHFNAPKKDQAWYYGEIIKRLTPIRDQALYLKLVHLYKDVFSNEV